MIIKKIYIPICILQSFAFYLLFFVNTSAQETENTIIKINDLERTNYKDRLIDYADIYTYELDEQTKDTIIYVRKINQWWFGIYGGPTINLSFGALYSMIDPNNDNNIFNTSIDFNSAFGDGYSLGLIGEWVRPNSDWSLGLKLGLYDKTFATVASEDIAGYYAEHFNYEADFVADLTYISLNPYVKYSFPFFDGLFVNAGLNIGISTGTTAYLQATFNNTGGIYHKMPLNDIKANKRLLVDLGIGYDFFIADFFAANYRVRITPFADFKLGTNIISENGSNWNNAILNVGLQIKLAPDVVEADTLKYDPKSEFTPEYFASLKSDDGVEFAGFIDRRSNPQAFDMVMIIPPSERPELIDIAVIKPEEKNPQVQVEVNTKPETKLSPVTRVVAGDTIRIHGYASSNSTTLTDDMKAQLNEFVKYMKENPRAIVRIAGHSDNRGSLTENNNRSRTRANVAMNYLMSQGISRDRIFADARGAVNPIALNTTAAGRNRNRRIEIVIQR